MQNEKLRNADFSGPAGQAWRIDLNKIRRELGVGDDEDGTRGVWVIHIPGSHPFWPWYRLAMYHLRPHKNFDNPMFYLPGATHEFVLYALDPEFCPPDVEAVPQRILTPANFASQIICESDQDAFELIEEKAILPMVNGYLSPDTDFTGQWVSVFGDSMMRK